MNDGPTTSDEPAQDTASDGLAILELVSPLWSEERTREALGGLSTAEVTARRADGSLLGLQAADGGVFVYPVFQFHHRDGDVQVRPHLQIFMKALAYQDPWSVAVMCKTPAPELHDLTPLNWVRQHGDVHRLRDYAHILAAELSR